MTARRLAYIVNVFPKLSETFIAHEVAELLRRGATVEIFSLRVPQDGIRHEVVTSAGLDKVAHYEVEKFPELLARFKPELIHAHFATEPTAAAREFCRQLKIPFTFTAHGYDIRRKPPADLSERAAAAARVITVSQANAVYLQENFQIPKEHIRVIPCGVDLSLFKRGTRNGTSTVPLVVCVARHVKVKNLGMLLEACARLRERKVAFRCVMVGDGPLRGELEEQRKQLELENLVEMVGAAPQQEVLQWWQKASVAVLSSENEGMPVCLMEAAACGVPAVAPAVGGIPELMVNESTGLLSAPGDANALAEGLERLLRDAELRKNLGRAAELRAHKLFSLSSQVNALLDVWTEILNHERKAHSSD